jgi:thioredoxin reductase (NADPH)
VKTARIIIRNRLRGNIKKDKERGMTDVLIIGGGPAGVSAALYTARAGFSTRLVYKDFGALATAERIENFYGQATPNINGAALVGAGLAQAAHVGVDVVQDEAVGLCLTDFFTVEAVNASYRSKVILLATGASRTAPAIPGLKAFEGRGVSYCAVCDAFFYRGKDVAVLGNGAYARQEARELEPLVKSVTMLNPDDAAEIIGDKTLTAVKLKNGGELPVSGLFVAVGVAGGTDLAKKLGATVNGGGIIVDENLRTGIPGLWAAGDCVAGMRQIAKAVYDGALAGMEAVRYLRGLNRN